MKKSQYGNWESVGEIADGALWTVAGRHHIHSTPREGYACLCGEKTLTARASTEHIMDVTMKALAVSGCSITEPTEQES